MRFLLIRLMLKNRNWIKSSKKAKIPVIVVDAPIYDESLVNCSIASNNYDAGVLCAKDMMSKRDHAKIIY